MTDRTIFVTGGTGLVGSHLLFKLISGGEKVKAVYRKSSNPDITKKIFSYYSVKGDELFNSIEWIECDICEYEVLRKAMENTSRVYHCAASVSFETGLADSIIKNNVEGTANVVRSCIENKTDKLCHVSSIAAIGASDNEVAADENQVWNNSEPHSPYAISKYLSEAEVWRGIKGGLNAVIVNPSVILGPGNWNRGSSQYFSNISRGMLFYTNGVTGYVDVNDVADSMIRLMNSEINGERFIISSENLSFRDIFTIIAKSLGVRKPFIYVPKAISYPAISILQLISAMTGKRSPVTTETIKSAYSKVFFDNSKIIKATGMKFITIAESVATTSAKFKSENQKVM
jgi:dihydroflavonol-4-reductase